MIYDFVAGNAKIKIKEKGRTLIDRSRYEETQYYPVEKYFIPRLYELMYQLTSEKL